MMVSLLQAVMTSIRVWKTKQTRLRRWNEDSRFKRTSVLCSQLSMQPSDVFAKEPMAGAWTADSLFQQNDCTLFPGQHVISPVNCSGKRECSQRCKKGDSDDGKYTCDVCDTTRLDTGSRRGYCDHA